MEKQPNEMSAEDLKKERKEIDADHQKDVDEEKKKEEEILAEIKLVEGTDRIATEMEINEHINKQRQTPEAFANAQTSRTNDLSKDSLNS